MPWNVYLETLEERRQRAVAAAEARTLTEPIRYRTPMFPPFDLWKHDTWEPSEENLRKMRSSIEHRRNRE